MLLPPLPSILILVKIIIYNSQITRDDNRGGGRCWGAGWRGWRAAACRATRARACSSTAGQRLYYIILYYMYIILYCIVLYCILLYWYLRSCSVQSDAGTGLLVHGRSKIISYYIILYYMDAYVAASVAIPFQLCLSLCLCQEKSPPRPKTVQN